VQGGLGVGSNAGMAVVVGVKPCVVVAVLFDVAAVSGGTERPPMVEACTWLRL
jgi:hypothetical protein